MAKGQTLQDPFLNILRKEKVPVSIYLVNGIKLQGQVDSFDQFVVLLKNSVNQMVYKHAISTVVPSRNVRLPLPMKKRGSGLLRALTISPAITAPAERASSTNSSRSESSGAPSRPAWTRIARSPLCGRSNKSALPIRRPRYETIRCRLLRRLAMADVRYVTAPLSKSHVCIPFD